MAERRCEICQRKMVAPRRGRGFRQCQGCSDRALVIANDQDVDFGTALELARDEFVWLSLGHGSLVWSGPVDLNTKQGGRWVRKDSPIVFQLVGPEPAVLPPNGYVNMGRGEIWRDVTPDELVALCGEDAPEQCQEFEDESGRWHRV